MQPLLWSARGAVTEALVDVNPPAGESSIMLLLRGLASTPGFNFGFDCSLKQEGKEGESHLFFHLIIPRVLGPVGLLSLLSE